MKSIPVILATLAVLSLAACGTQHARAAGEIEEAADVRDASNITWRFQNMDALYPVAQVSRGDGPVRSLVSRPQDLSSVTFRGVDGAQSTIDNFIARTRVGALLVVQDGGIVFEHYGNGQSPETRHIVWSVTKSFTALLAEMLIADGILDDDAMIGTYVPELQGSAFGDATIRQALNMQVGADFTEDYADPNSSIAEFIFSAGLMERPPGSAGPDSLHAFLPTIAKKGDHGGLFQYNTATTEVVGWTVERASGKPVNALFSELIYARIGAEADAFFLAADANRTAMAGGGLSVTARDLARLGLLVLQDGQAADGTQVVPAGIIESIRAADLSLQDWAVPDGTSTYRSFWYVNAPRRTTVAMGVHGQMLYVAPDSHLVAVLLSSNDDADGDFFVDAEFLFNALSDHFADRPAEAGD